MENRQPLQQMFLGKLDICLQKTETISLSLTLYKYQLKVDLSLRPETLKQLQEVVGNAMEHIGIGSNFLNRTPVAQQIQERLKKWDCDIL
jgi:hypothetical protein